MNIASFIASKILRSGDRRQISRPIVRIATIGISVGVVLMVLALAGLRGFQKEIRNKVIGFGSHFQVVNGSDDLGRESDRMVFDPNIYDQLKKVDGVRHVQIFATKPGILETKEALQGVVIKGTGKDFDWDFLQSNLKEGVLPRKDSLYDIVVSSFIARRLKMKLGDKTSLYFVNHESDARQQNFTVCGIYETGLEDFDEKYIFIDISNVQRLSGWGLQAQMLVDSACSPLGTIAVGAMAYGGQGEFVFDWDNKNWTDGGPFFISPSKDTTLKVIVSDDAHSGTDTAYAFINFIDDSSKVKCRPFSSEIRTSGGSYNSFIGGYEVLISDYNQLEMETAKIHDAIPFYMQIVRVTDRNPEIFSWLKMLDINVVIIIILMIGISIVNMTSALLIIILERQNMIGTLKAFGILDRTVLKVFLINAAFIIGKGLLIGNAIGIGLALIQQKFGLIRLDPENYYVDRMPIHLDFMELGMLNLLTLSICMIVLIVPALFVTSITPIKAIRFD